MAEQPDFRDFVGEVANDKGDDVGGGGDGDCHSSMLHHLEIRNPQCLPPTICSKNIEYQAHPLVNWEPGLLLREILQGSHQSEHVIDTKPWAMGIIRTIVVN